MSLKAEIDAAACVLRSKRAQSGLGLTERAALAGPTAREFVRRLAPPRHVKLRQRIEISERVWGAVKPTRPKGDSP